ncbi:hypothetical protein D3C80_2108980 [compost metagenome]
MLLESFTIRTGSVKMARVREALPVPGDLNLMDSCFTNMIRLLKVRVLHVLLGYLIKMV